MIGMDTLFMKDHAVKGKDGMNKAMGLLVALRQFINMQMSQRFLCGFIVGRIWMRLSIPALLEFFATPIL